MNKPVVIDLMGDGKTCSQRAIEQQVMAAIKPQLDRADELLDYYTEGLPREVWLPIAYQFKPKTIGERLQDSVKHVTTAFNNFSLAVAAMSSSFDPVFKAAIRAEQREHMDLMESS